MLGKQSAVEHERVELRASNDNPGLIEVVVEHTGKTLFILTAMLL